MDLERGLGDGIDDALDLHEVSPLIIGPDLSTPVLRSCTALAARARVDLLAGGRHTAGTELEHVLATIDGWQRSQLVDPDPTMVVLASAALQDLEERLPSSGSSTLASRVRTVLPLLHTLMRRESIDALA